MLGGLPRADDNLCLVESPIDCLEVILTIQTSVLYAISPSGST